MGVALNIGMNAHWEAAMRIEAESTVDLGNGIFLNLETGCTEERDYPLECRPNRRFGKDRRYTPTKDDVLLCLRADGVFTF